MATWSMWEWDSAHRACKQHLHATARLIAAEGYKTFTVRAADGVPGARQAVLLCSLLNKHARQLHSGFGGWTSDVSEDQWYVDATYDPSTMVTLLVCKYEEVVGFGGGWTAQT